MDEMKDHRLIGRRSSICFVKERFVDEAMDLAANQGINGEPSGLAGLALLLQMRDKLPRDKRILIVNTGLTNYCPKLLPEK
jgi:threonine synthase